MSLIVEDGSVVANAASYATVAQFKAYSDDYGFSYAAFTDTQIEQFLRKGARYLVQSYRARWKGIRKIATQTLDWPRSGCNTEPMSLGSRWAAYYLVANTIVPTEVVNANIIMAQKTSDGTDLFADGTQRAAKKQVDPISIEYQVGSPQRIQFDAVEALLAPFLQSIGGVSIPLARG